MATMYNIYCDESCHLEADRIPVMVIGATWCPKDRVREISEKIRALKEAFGLARSFEIKWTKVSNAKYLFYRSVVDYFFDEPDLHFRGVVIPDKRKLDHAAFKQDHDSWYYKMFFILLKQILSPEANYNIYLDIKDTRSQKKVEILHDILSSNIYDFDKSIINKVQHTRSHEVETLQLTDLLIGMLGYLHRGLKTNQAKVNLIERVRQKTNFSLLHTTLPREEKFNLLIWSAREW